MEQSKKNANIELLRILSMLMVITLHALDKSGIMAYCNGTKPGTYVYIVLEALSICAVNVYVLISGYFLCKSSFKTGRLTELIFQVLFYSVGGLLAGLVFDKGFAGELDTYKIAEYIFPFHFTTYWFMSAYVVMYMLSPIIARGVAAMGKKAHKAVMVMLLLYECVFKSIIPIISYDDKKGYDALWFITLFVVSAYIRLYGIGFLSSASRGLILYLLSTVLIFAEKVFIDIVVAKTGRMKEMSDIRVSFHYNHLFVLLSAVGLFVFFLKKKEIGGFAARFVVAIAPMSLGVYLFHEHPLLRFGWPSLFGLDKFEGRNCILMIGIIAVAVICVYIVGTITDFVRRLLFGMVKKVFANTGLPAYMRKVDEYINANIQ